MVVSGGIMELNKKPLLKRDRASGDNPLLCDDCKCELVPEDSEDWYQSVYCPECYEKRAVNLED